MNSKVLVLGLAVVAVAAYLTFGRVSPPVQIHQDATDLEPTTVGKVHDEMSAVPPMSDKVMTSEQEIMARWNAADKKAFFGAHSQFKWTRFDQFPLPASVDTQKMFVRTLVQFVSENYDWLVLYKQLDFVLVWNYGRGPDEKYRVTQFGTLAQIVDQFANWQVKWWHVNGQNLDQAYRDELVRLNEKIKSR